MFFTYSHFCAHGWLNGLKRLAVKGCNYKPMTKNTMLVIPAGCVLYVEVDLIEDKIVPTSSTFFLNTQDHELKISCDKGPKPVVIS